MLMQIVETEIGGAHEEDYIRRVGQYFDYIIKVSGKVEFLRLLFTLATGLGSGLLRSDANLGHFDGTTCGFGRGHLASGDGCSFEHHDQQLDVQE